MNGEKKSVVTLAVLAIAFLALATAFGLNLWGIKSDLPVIPPVDGVYTNPTTVRLSARELEETGGDISGLDCYACHDQFAEIELDFDESGDVIVPEEHRGLVFARMNCEACHKESESVEIEWDEDFNVIVPEAHQGPVMQHGRNDRNNNCFNCHIQDNLPMLKTREGRELTAAESNLLCASCHGPKYRDWEAGIHGRINGYWNSEQGEKLRKDCTSCHDPHSPAFPEMIPGPGPHTLHEKITGQDLNRNHYDIESK